MLTGSALIWTYVATGICLFIWANLVYAVWRGRNQVAAGKNWARAAGVIVTSKAEVPPSHTSDEDSDCTPTVRYRFSVDGKTYEGSHIQFGGQPDTMRMLAEQIVAKYPAGAPVDVFYDPKQPDNAVLQGKSAVAPALYVMLIVFTGACAVLASHSVAGKVLTTPNGVPLFAFLVLLIPIALGVFLVGNFFKIRRERKASAHWPTAAGTITLSTVREQVEIEEDDRRRREVIKYVPDIRYRYRVGSRDYAGGTVAWGWNAIYGDQGSAAAVTAKYPGGGSVTVYYDPANPESAVLEPSSRSGAVVPLLAAALMGGIGFFFLWAFIQIG
jgi:hypothetical protein